MNFLGLKFQFGKNKKEENFVTISEWIDFIECINGTNTVEHGDPLYYLKDKTILLKRMGEKLGRDFIDLEVSPVNTFVKFISKHKKIIAKPKAWSCGQGIEIINITDDIKPNKLYATLIEQKKCLIEEYIVQHSCLSEIYPEIVSTLRIYTLNIEGHAEIVSHSLLRIPTSYNGIKNTDVITLKIDSVTGKCKDYGILSDSGVRSIMDTPVHPHSGYNLAGFEVPYFKQAEELALYAAQLVPEVPFAGWDIAITENGPVIIEGNGDPYNFLDENYISSKEKISKPMDYYKRMLEYVEFRKNLKQDQVDKLTTNVFTSELCKNSEPDVVIILCDSKYSYDIAHFLSKYGNHICVCMAIGEVNLNYNDNKNIYTGSVKSYKQAIENSFKIVKNIISNSELKQVSLSRKLKVDVCACEFMASRISKLLNRYKKDYDISFSGIYTLNVGKDDWYKTFYGYQIVMDELNL